MRCSGFALQALSNQKFRELSEEFGDVGLMTGAGGACTQRLRQAKHLGGAGQGRLTQGA